VILSSSYGAPNTTVTLITNNDYAMAATTITDTYYSYSSPPDFPSSFAFTPVWTASTPPSIGDGSFDASFSAAGKQLTVRIKITMGGTTTYGVGAWQFGLASGVVTKWVPSAVLGFDNGTAFRTGVSLHMSTSVFEIESNVAAASWQATVPHTWASGDYLESGITAWL